MLSSVTRQTQSTHVRIDWPVKGRSVSFVCKTKQLYKVPQKRKTKQIITVQGTTKEKDKVIQQLYNVLQNK
jgi:hypothetical protein